jgi:hypothetical protein
MVAICRAGFAKIVMRMDMEMEQVVTRNAEVQQMTVMTVILQ